ncbi:hypothetical protein Ae505Ps2_1058c [Pseudonocardia sp. Ae505_Ps2]|nr:hypothetical protein Ae505Ps2_1058c [Pseudonocardia sp. Ae505_Ps2]
MRVRLIESSSAAASTVSMTRGSVGSGPYVVTDAVI